MKVIKYSREMEDNLMGLYNRASFSERMGGKFWYDTANRECGKVAERLGVPIRKVVGVVAALSPGLAWEKNIATAATFIEAYLGGGELPMVGVYGKRNAHKARMIMDGVDPLSVILKKSGPKTYNFFHNILTPYGSEEFVTIDRHAKCAALNFASEKNSVVRTAEYEGIALHYRIVAQKLDMYPNQLQAIVWTTWRNLKYGKRSQNTGRSFALGSV